MMYPDLQGLVVCRHFLDDATFQTILACIADPSDANTSSTATAALLEQAEILGLSGNVLRRYVVWLLCEGDNIAAASIEQNGRPGKGLMAAMAADMTLLWPYIKASASDITGNALLDAYEPAALRQDNNLDTLSQALSNAVTPAEGAQVLLSHYAVYGRGKLARFMAFRLDETGQAVGIDPFPQFAWEDLIGYDMQKAKLLANTDQFMAGKEANNVLLTGSRGTGKSTAVKALIYRYYKDGLRLLQISRGQLLYLPAVMEKLSRIRSKKFILFFDDLSFDEDEKEYKYLKSAIDGGATPQPDNVLIYATSNRRHLLKETWRDRNDDLDEVYRDDSTNESISLADRFGLILHYSAPTQDEYLRIIDNELQKAGVHLSQEELRIQGIRWEMEHSGRNGRIARQFVKWYLGNQK
ncbi:MAG: ATP-binding protein [Megasphaera sp.]|jgi:predicted AAA+ superfamily ATPase|nr:ATP-binding protein [Megasphaera sp.]MCH4188267.1 ATP-binding protein [Megasphaera sp.]MCH4218043.1 ATP-binding protein [Megasphaera sp.]